MNKSLLLLMIISLSFVIAQGQDITRDFFPAIGEKIIYALDNSPQQPWSSLDIHSSWDISWAKQTDSATVMALDPSHTNWAAQITGSNYVLTYFTPTDSVYYYYNLTDTGIYQVGVVIYAEGQYVPFRYNQPSLFMPFPFQPGDTIWNAKTASTSIYGIPVQLTHNDSIFYIGSGNITLPGGSQFSVALLKHYSYINVFAQNLINETYEDNILEWYDLDAKHFIASADTSMSLQRFASVQYLDTITNSSAAVRQILQNIKISPNPTNNYLIINALPESYKLKVYDLQGKLILEKQFFQNLRLNIAQLNNGMYILHLQGKEGTLDFKFIKN